MLPEDNIHSYTLIHNKQNKYKEKLGILHLSRDHRHTVKLMKQGRLPRCLDLLLQYTSVHLIPTLVLLHSLSVFL